MLDLTNKERYQLTKEDIDFLTFPNKASYAEFRKEANELCYKNFSDLFDKARPRQRGYIHGMSKKLSIDEYGSLPYYEGDIRMLNVLQAGEVIEILKDLYDKMESSDDSIF